MILKTATYKTMNTRTGVVVTEHYQIGEQTIFKAPLKSPYPLSNEDKDWIDKQRSYEDTLHSLRIQLIGLIRSNHPDIPEKYWRTAFNTCISNVYPKKEQYEKE